MKIDKYQILNIVIIVFAVVLVINIFATTGRLVSDFDRYTPDDESLLYQVKNGDYADLVGSVNNRKYIKPDDTQTFRELSAVAEYFEAASIYHAYQESGNTEKAAKFQQKMDESNEMLGDLGFAKEDIDKKLVIE